MTAICLDLRAGLTGWHPVEDMSFTLDELARATGGILLDAPGKVVLDRLVTDSRQAGPGALFVALAGEAMDGHDFIPGAVAAGTSALLCQRLPVGVAATPRVIVPDTREALVAFSRDRLTSCGVRVVGVTGSAGKTTTKEMIAAVLARRLKVQKTEGNLNTYTGLPMTLAHLEQDHQVFVAEYGMSALGEIAFLARMAPPDIAVVLNVGLAHVGLLGGMEQVAAAKRELVEALPAAGIAVLNADDERVAAMAPTARGQVVFYGVGEAGGPGGASYFATDVRLHGLAGTTFTLHAPSGTVAVELAVPGLHSVSNAVAAAAVGDLNGVPLQEAAAALAAFRPVGGRMNVRAGRAGSLVIDDAYNASPGSMEASLQVLRSEPGRRRIAVLGDMLELGDEAADAHRRVGIAAARSADLLVALGEQAGVLVEAARAAGMAPDRALAVEDVDHALMAIEPELPGALVLVKASRGMALDRVVDRLVQA